MSGTERETLNLKREREESEQKVEVSFIKQGPLSSFEPLTLLQGFSTFTSPHGHVSVAHSIKYGGVAGEKNSSRPLQYLSDTYRNPGLQNQKIRFSQIPKSEWEQHN